MTIIITCVSVTADFCAIGIQLIGVGAGPPKLSYTYRIIIIFWVNILV
jgi:hypothetical protein